MSHSADDVAVKVVARILKDEELEPVDLLANLLHWCKANDTDFEVLLDSAREYYVQELIPNE